LIDFKEVQKQLKYLQEKYKVGFDIKLDWQPRDLKLRPRITRPDGIQLIINGEWTQNGQIIIYEDKDLKKAIHLLNHEFIEKMLIESLVDPYLIYANSLKRVFETFTYKTQEKQINSLTKLEDDHYDKVKRKS